jgi:ABC-type Fe3+-siderophore transport system permease subunit
MRGAARSMVPAIMSTRLTALIVVIGLFGVLTALALMDVGFLGIIAPHFRSWGGGQVLADLVILAVLACMWMVADGRARGINPWPFVIATLLVGSFGVLSYLVVREVRANASRPVPARSRA